MGCGKGGTWSLLCPITTSALRQGRSWGTFNKYNFSLPHGGHHGPRYVVLSLGTLEITPVDGHCGCGRLTWLGQAVGSSLGPAPLLAFTVASWASCQWAEGGSQLACTPQGVALLGSQPCGSADLTGFWYPELEEGTQSQGQGRCRDAMDCLGPPKIHRLKP